MLRSAATLSAICLLLVLPPTAGFYTTVCNGCKCTEGTPYVIDCSDKDFQSAYTSYDTWPSNQSDIQLIYDKNSLTEVAELPDQAQNITVLSYQHNDIVRIADGAFTALPRLRRLDLSHNKLSRSSMSEKSFGGVFSANDYQPSPIQQLDLSYNSIHSIMEDTLSHFSSLTELSLSYNPMPVLDHHTRLALTSLTRLRTLNLAGTGLSELPHTLLHSLITLRNLDLADNQLTEVPLELHNSHAIEKLILDKNPIKDINEESFRGMKKLEILNISDMPKLEYITDNTFSTLVALRILRCRNNKRLWSVSPRIFQGLDTSPGIFPLEELLMSGNNLTTLEATTVPYWNQLTLLQLHDNPWRCDCRLQWMADSLLPELKKKDEKAAKLITCRLPKKLAGVPLLEAANTTDGQLPCPPESYHSLGPSGSGTTLAAALTIGGVVIFSATCVVLFLFWKRNMIRERYSNKLYVTSQLGAILVLLVCLFFFWFVVVAARSGSVPPGDPLLLRLMGCFVVFLLISTGAAVFVIRRQTEAAKYRAKQQIRYRRAAMEEEAGMEDTAQVVST